MIDTQLAARSRLETQFGCLSRQREHSTLGGRGSGRLERCYVSQITMEIMDGRRKKVVHVNRLQPHIQPRPDGRQCDGDRVPK